MGFERDLQERLAAARETWRSSELPAALDEARLAWQQSMLGDFPTVSICSSAPARAHAHTHVCRCSNMLRHMELVY